MTDLLVKLYDLPFNAIKAPEPYVIRKPIAAENAIIAHNIAETFSLAWAEEFRRSMVNSRISAFIATIENSFAGFACYDAAALGVFGPTGVVPEARNNGVGAALMRAALLDMKAAGYAYSVIGGAGPLAYYEKNAGAIPIEGSDPGFYADLLRPQSK